jgi:hypothetical protein
VSQGPLHVEVHYEDRGYWAEVKELPGCFGANQCIPSCASSCAAPASTRLLLRARRSPLARRAWHVPVRSIHHSSGLPCTIVSPVPPHDARERLGRTPTACLRVRRSAALFQRLAPKVRDRVVEAIREDRPEVVESGAPGRNEGTGLTPASGARGRETSWCR